VDKSGRLESVVGGLGRHPGGGEFPQLVVHEREELLGGARVPLFNGDEDAGDLAHGVEDTRRGAELLCPSGEWVPIPRPSGGRRAAKT
jgi:hypothetical protein